MGGLNHHAPGVAAMGVLMLDTRFPRPLGDVGNPASFPFPVRYRVVQGASPERVVQQQAVGLLQPFIDAAHELVQAGCVGISTTCGFLVLFQRELAAALPVPVMTSSLLQIPALQAMLAPGQQVGVVTISAASLTQAHLAAAGANGEVPVEGVNAAGEMARAILGNQTTLDTALVQAEVVQAALRLIARQPAVKAIVLECTNMPPYADAVREATGLPVYDALTALMEFWEALTSRREL